MSIRLFRIVLLLIVLIGAGCANITAPTGGRRDLIPPKLVSVTPADSLRNTRIKRIELYFDEYITVNDPTREVQLSPILAIAPTVTGLNKHVVVKIVDSLLEDNTTYRLSFGNAIKDLHEGNAYKNFTYTFSTGAYFDSLQMHGTVVDAATGLPGVDGAIVELYYASESDSAVVRHKPKYIAKADPATGVFSFKGLPRRTFRMYALKDGNDNLIYDGPGPGDMIGFLDNTVVPGDTSQAAIRIKVFAEIPDTLAKKSLDSMAYKREKGGSGNRAKPSSKDALSYSVGADTSNAERRTFDINQPLKVTFNRPPALNYDKITLTYDSSGTAKTPKVSVGYDSVKHVVSILPAWKSNTLYTLRLAKGFAKDSAGTDVVPSRYVFRTKDEEDDYGAVTVKVPAKYVGGTYLLKVLADGDSVSQRQITDSAMEFRRLKPASYTFRIIDDRNQNGKWDPGDLFAKKQPEDVIPSTPPDKLVIKPGWKVEFIFEQKPNPIRAKMGESGKGN